jgi:hypothetical protein
MQFVLAVMAASIGIMSASATEKADGFPAFEKIQLSDKYWSEGGAIVDIDRDGHIDVVAGPYWYSGPKFSQRHVYYPASQRTTITDAKGKSYSFEGFDGALGTGKFTFCDNNYSVARDLNKDGWPDIIVIGHTAMQPNGEFYRDKSPVLMAYWYENPGKTGGTKSSSWTRHLLAKGVDNESAALADLFNDGQPVIIGMSGGNSGENSGRAGYFAPDALDPVKPWIFHPISWPVEEFQWNAHGLGYGDLNNDGRNDMLGSDGWWEQPAFLTGDPVWRYHPYPFQLDKGQVKLHGYVGSVNPLRIPILAEQEPNGITRFTTVYGGSQLYVDEINDDGLPDVVTSLAAHGYGLVWWEQQKNDVNQPGPAFAKHVIVGHSASEGESGIFLTQMQAVQFVDIDGDGLKDIVTGKRYWGHGNVEFDPDPNGPAVLYVFRQTRTADGVKFIPHLIDDNSGAGYYITVGDVNADGRPDIVVATKKGAFVFVRTARAALKAHRGSLPPRRPRLGAARAGCSACKLSRAAELAGSERQFLLQGCDAVADTSPIHADLPATRRARSQDPRKAWARFGNDPSATPSMR